MNNDTHGARRRAAKIGGAVALANILVWVWAYLALHGQPVLFGAALLAYLLGLRHALDADHIAAIDIATRKLVRLGVQPVATGLFFSLGHASIVVCLSVVSYFMASSIASHFDALRSVGGAFGTTVSVLFLAALAWYNLHVWLELRRTYRSARQGELLKDAELDIMADKHGVLARLFSPLFRLVSRSWHMLPIGFLFGLGFDTATTVALFGLSAVQMVDGLSLSMLLLFPVLFTAGITLLDTADGMLMLGVYAWASRNPLRKLRYNMVITALSVLIAVLVSGVQAFGLLADLWGFQGGFWNVIEMIREDFHVLGYLIVGAFIAAWTGSALLYRGRKQSSFDDGVADGLAGR